MLKSSGTAAKVLNARLICLHAGRQWAAIAPRNDLISTTHARNHCSSHTITDVGSIRPAYRPPAYRRRWSARMSWDNKVIWSEGLFLRPQHLQQNDRYVEKLVRSRSAGLRGYG